MHHFVILNITVYISSALLVDVCVCGCECICVSQCVQSSKITIN